MATLPSQSQVEQSVVKYGLSDRAAQNSFHFLPWDMLEDTRKSLRTPSNPDGLVFLGVAENPLLYEDVTAFIKSNMTICPDDQYGYGVGPRGSPRLKKALTTFFHSEFHAKDPVLEKELLILPGVGGVLDSLTWAICNEGEGIIIPVPFWSGISQGVGERARGVLIPATYQDVEGYQGLDDLFDPAINKNALQMALDKATKEGIKVRAVMLCNPHNPLGKCYPVEALEGIADFCGQHKLHLISDEVYAMSVYDRPDIPDATPFTSLLALNLDSKIDSQNVHVAYGMSKDFCATGFRLGVLHSRNEGLITAVSTISVLGWVPYIVQDIWADMLMDDEFRVNFMRKNRLLLQQHAAILTTFLEKHSIPFYSKANAGVYVWANLQRYLYDRSLEDQSGFSALQLFKANEKLYRDREMALWNKLLGSGVGLGLGSWYSSEEPGWFRISFAVAKEDLLVGLERLINVLHDVEEESWE